MRRSLAGPFALIGAAGGWLTADAFGLGTTVTHVDEGFLRTLLVLVTPAMSAVVGWAATRGGRTSSARFFLLPMAGGVANGAIIGLFALFPVGAIFGAVYGAMMGAAFLPFLAPAFAAAHAAKARPGSMLARVEQRAAWMGAFLAIAIGALVPAHMLSGSLAQRVPWRVEIFLTWAAALGAVLVALLDALDYARIRARAALPLAPRTARPAATTLDFGVGDEAGEETLPARSAYRDAEGVARAVLGSGARATRQAGARLVLDVFAIGLAALALIARAAIRPPPPPVPYAATPASTAPDPGPVQVVYTAPWGGTARLLGVDTVRGQAYVVLEQQDPPRYAIDTIDLASGTRASRWEASEARTAEHLHVGSAPGYPPAFSPLTSTFQDDLARLAAMTHATGPHATRPALFDPVLATSPDGAHVVYDAMPNDGHDGDWLFMADAAGAHPVRVGAGERASYAPIFSPDGAKLAWHGCGIPCSSGYYLYIADVAGDLRGDRIDAVDHPKEPVWSADGAYVYAVTQHNRRSGPTCLYRIGAPRPHRVTSLFCSHDLQDLRFDEDPTGATGIVSGWLGKPGQQAGVLHWLALPSGEIKRSLALDGSTGGLAPGPDGLALGNTQGSLAVLDLASGSHTAIDPAQGWILAWDAQWLDGRTLAAVRSRRGSFDLVEVDAARLVGRAP